MACQASFSRDQTGQSVVSCEDLVYHVGKILILQHISHFLYMLLKNRQLCSVCSNDPSTCFVIDPFFFYVHVLAK